MIGVVQRLILNAKHPLSNINIILKENTDGVLLGFYIKNTTNDNNLWYNFLFKNNEHIIGFMYKK